MFTEEMPETAEDCYTICGLPVDTSVLFSDKKGRRKKRIEKRKVKLLQKVAFLAKFLDPDEQIVFVATGCSPFSLLDHFTTGQIWLYLLKRSLFVFTNKRLFHVPTTTHFEYRQSVAQVLYEDLKGVRVRGGALTLEYQGGGKEKFQGIPRRDLAIIKQVQIEACDDEIPSSLPGRNHLCPNCTQVLTAETRACSACGLRFKTKVGASLRSIFLPGGGYFYTGHPWMGLGDALVELSLLVFIGAAGAAAGLLGDPEALEALLVLAPVLILEKLITIYHANHFVAEFIPAKRQPLPAGTDAPAPPPVEAQMPEQQSPAEEILSVR